MKATMKWIGLAVVAALPVLLTAEFIAIPLGLLMAFGIATDA